MCFQIDDKSGQAAKCVKSRITNKVIYCVLFIGKFEQQYVVIKVVLQSLRLKYQVKTIGIDQSLRNSALFIHICLQNINKLYKHAGKCNNQQQFKDIIETAMVSTTGLFTDTSPISPMNPETLKKPSARKSLCLFTNILYVKKMLYVELELLNQSTMHLNPELLHGH